MATCRGLGISWQLATSHLNLGVALLHCGRADEAVARFDDALRQYRVLGDDIFAARVVNHIAHAALADNDLARADRLASEALASVTEQGERQGVAEALETLAAVAAKRSAVDRAATLAGAAAAIRDTIASHAAPFDVAITGPHLDRIKGSVSEERWHRAWDRGAALDWMAAVAYALAN